VQSQRSRSNRFCESGDSCGIAAEAADKALDPVECGKLVVEPEVGGWCVFGGCFIKEVLTCQETLSVQSIAVWSSESYSRDREGEGRLTKC
jgi:hypothetical protein